MNTKFVTITPPLQIIDIGNRCEASSSTIYIPAKSELTATMQSVTRSMFFLHYNHKYKNMSQYLVWLQISSTVLMEKEQHLQKKLKFLDPMPMQEFEKELEQTDTPYLFSMPTGLQLSVQIVVGIFFIIIIVIGFWLYCKHRSHLQGLWQLTLKAPDLLQSDLGPITKLFSSNHSTSINEPPIFAPLHVQPTTSVLHPSY